MCDCTVYKPVETHIRTCFSFSQKVTCLCRCACDRDGIWSTPAAGRAGAAGPTGSLSSSVGKIGSDDELSLNDYASLTPGKFTEDGSFIGQYNQAMKYKPSQQPPPAYNQSTA